MSETNAAPNIDDAAEMLWIVLANVSGGDWTKQSMEWQEAAARWRDYYFAARTSCSNAQMIDGQEILPPAGYVKPLGSYEKLDIVRDALRDVLNMHATQDGHYRDTTGAMKRARAALAKVNP